MKNIIAIVVSVAVSAVAMGGTLDSQQWQAPIYGADTNATQTFEFTAGSLGVLDFVQLMPQTFYTNTVAMTIVTKSGAYTNTYAASQTVSNGVPVALFPRTDHYLLQIGDKIVLTYGSPAAGKSNAWVIWLRDVLK